MSRCRTKGMMGSSLGRVAKKCSLSLDASTQDGRLGLDMGESEGL